MSQPELKGCRIVGQNEVIQRGDVYQFEDGIIIYPCRASIGRTAIEHGSGRTIPIFYVWRPIKETVKGNRYVGCIS